jgi:hypothetical protein
MVFNLVILAFLTQRLTVEGCLAAFLTDHLSLKTKLAVCMRKRDKYGLVVYGIYMPFYQTQVLQRY